MSFKSSVLPTFCCIFFRLLPLQMSDFLQVFIVFFIFYCYYLQVQKLQKILIVFAVFVTSICVSCGDCEEITQNSHQLLQSQHVEHPGGLLNNVKLDYGSGLWSLPLSARQNEQTINYITSEFWIWTFQSATVKSVCCVTSLCCSTEKTFVVSVCCFFSL